MSTTTSTYPKVIPFRRALIIGLIAFLSIAVALPIPTSPGASNQTFPFETPGPLVSEVASSVVAVPMPLAPP